MIADKIAKKWEEQGVAGGVKEIQPIVAILSGTGEFNLIIVLCAI